MKLDDDRLTFVAQQEVTALDAIHKAVLGKAACAGRVTEGVGTCISIHAPTWGATWHVVASIGQCDISIHAPTWSATTSARPPPAYRQISIHAPTWGATLGAVKVRSTSTIFQSTHPRGVRLREGIFCLNIQDFNPRTHVGCDITRYKNTGRYEISIHAPTWGATRVSYNKRFG